MPQLQSDHEANHAGQVDLAQLRRGRMIGNLERLLLTVLVAAGSYTGLTFLIALKGLTRFEKLNDQDFAEYFLLGSLLSVLIGLVAGLLIRMTLIALWPELLALEMQPSMF